MGKPDRKPSRFGAGAKAWLGTSAVAVDATAVVKTPQQAMLSTEGAIPPAVGDGPVAMDSEATKAKKKKTKGVFAVVVKKRGSGSKVQKNRKLKRLQKALSHQEKLVSKDVREEQAKPKRSEAKGLWGSSKADTNKFAVLAT